MAITIDVAHIGDRIAIVVERPEFTIISELDLINADLLLSKLQDAVAFQIEQRRATVR